MMGGKERKRGEKGNEHCVIHEDFSPASPTTHSRAKNVGNSLPPVPDAQI
jgi:hypothetical protein